MNIKKLKNSMQIDLSHRFKISHFYSIDLIHQIHQIHHFKPS